MSYEIKSVIGNELAPNFSNVRLLSSGKIDFPSSTFAFQDQDVVHVRYKSGNFRKGIYLLASVKDSATNFTFDSNVYPFDATVLAANVLGASVYRASGFTKISQVDFNVEVAHGLFSNEYKKYSTSKDFTLSINAENKRFFDSFDDYAYEGKMVIADFCNDYAYGIALRDNNYGLIKNVFNTKILFNVATR